MRHSLLASSSEDNCCQYMQAVSVFSSGALNWHTWPLKDPLHTSEHVQLHNLLNTIDLTADTKPMTNTPHTSRELTIHSSTNSHDKDAMRNGANLYQNCGMNQRIYRRRKRNIFRLSKIINEPLEVRSLQRQIHLFTSTYVSSWRYPPPAEKNVPYIDTALHIHHIMIIISNNLQSTKWYRRKGLQRKPTLYDWRIEHTPT